MRHIYENRTRQVQRLFLLTEDNKSGNQIILSPGSKIELSYPGLDKYVPHLLIKFNEQGFNISNAVVANRRKAQLDSKSEDQAPAVDSKPVELVSPEAPKEAPVVAPITPVDPVITEKLVVEEVKAKKKPGPKKNKLNLFSKKEDEK